MNKLKVFAIGVFAGLFISIVINELGALVAAQQPQNDALAGTEIEAMLFALLDEWEQDIKKIDKATVIARGQAMRRDPHLSNDLWVAVSVRPIEGKPNTLQILAYGSPNRNSIIDCGFVCSEFSRHRYIKVRQ